MSVAPRLAAVPAVDAADPPYPADTRAKGWRFELDYERIRQSDTWALADPSQRPWLLMLWMVAWEQSPCGSLPTEDALIAARIGMPAMQFTEHRPVLMRGWVRATDGRLYHPVLSERVLEMIAYRREQAERASRYRASRGVTRDERVTTGEDTPARGVSNDTGTGTGTGTGTNTDAPDGASGASAKPPRATKKCPAGFKVTAELREWAKAEAPNADIDAETKVFRDHTFAHARTDWAGTWRNWMRKASNTPGRSVPGKQAAIEQRNRAAAERFAAQGGEK